MTCKPWWKFHKWGEIKMWKNPRFGQGPPPVMHRECSRCGKWKVLTPYGSFVEKGDAK